MQPVQLLRMVEEWPGVEYDIKWGNVLVISVAGKMFCVMASSGDPKGSISFKVEDERFLELTDRAGFIPAPYLARAKWVKVEDSGKVNGKELHALIRRNYELVRSRLAKKLQKELTDVDRGARLPT